MIELDCYVGFVPLVRLLFSSPFFQEAFLRSTIKRAMEERCD